MSIPFAVYDGTSGRIERAGVCREEDVAAQAQAAGEVAVETVALVDPQKGYFVAGELAIRPANTVGVSVTGRVITLTGLPVGAKVQIAAPVYQTVIADDPSGSIAITVPVAGIYSISCDPFPGVPFAKEVTVL